MENISEHKHEVQIDRYLNNQLNAADAASFEVLMMEDPVVFERVQLLDALKQGLITDQEALLRDHVTTEQRSQRKTAVILPFTAWLRQPMSLAAALLIAVLGLQTFNS